MADDYTPSVDEAKGHYAASRVLTPQTYRRAEAEFDRMIAQVRAEAWDEGAEMGHRLYAEPWLHIAHRNPYADSPRHNAPQRREEQS